MSVVKVEKLFGSENLSLPVEIPVGFKPGGRALEGALEGATNVALFGREVELGGALEATARRLKKNEALSFFSTSVSEGEMHRPPADMAFTELVLGGGAAVAGAASTVQGPLVVALEGKAEARIGYRCVQPVPSRTSTKNALKSLGLAVRTPGRVRLGDLEPGVFHRYTSTLR